MRSLRVLRSWAAGPGACALVLSLCGFAEVARGLPLFETPSLEFQAGPYPASVAVGDLDRDGRPDLVIGQSACVFSNAAYHCITGSLAVLLGRGDGTFGDAAFLSTGPGAESVALADLNGDGRLDVVVASQTSNSVSVHLGRGDGTLEPHVSFATGVDPRSVALGDLDGDGATDVITANSGAGTVTVLLGHGDGTFAPGVDYETGSNPRGVVLGDVNGDSHLDAVTADHASHTVSVLVGRGDGTLNPRSSHPTSTGPHSVAIGDFDRDGRMDLATVLEGGTVAILLGSETGTFAPAVVGAHGTTRPPGSSRRFERPSVLPTAQARARFARLERLLASRVAAAAAIPIYDRMAVTAGDLDGDGWLDLAATLGVPEEYGTLVFVLLGRGDGTFDSPVRHGRASGPQSVVMADVNGDSKPDLVSANRGDLDFLGNATIFLGNGDGTFGSGGVSHGGHVPKAVGDLDGDGKLDIVSAAPHAVSVVFGVGDGTFTGAREFATAATPVSIAIADLDADGTPDLVAADYSTTAVAVLLGLGGRDFSHAAGYAVPDPLFWVGSGDLDRDGDVDVIGASDGRVVVLMGNGDGSLGSSVVTAVESGINSFVDGPGIGDFDEDGKLDLLVAVGDNDFALLLGNGDGSFRFGAGSPYWGGDFLTSMAVDDIDLDGHLDVATAGILFDYDPAWVSFGDGAGGFASQRVGLVGIDVYSLALADFDGDGLTDLATANTWGNDGTLTLWLGEVPRSFASRVDYGTGMGHGRWYVIGPRLVAADFDRDGRQDLLSEENVWLNRGGRSTCPDVSFEFKPRRLNVRADAQWASARITPPHPLLASEIDVSSIRLNGSVPASDPKLIGGNTLKVRFSREAVKSTLAPGRSVPLALTGMIAGECFRGLDTIRVKDPRIHKPDRSSRLAAGMTTEVVWDADPGAGPVTLHSSSDGGETWTVEAAGLPNTGRYLWTVPASLTSPSWLAVSSSGLSEGSDVVADAEWAVSEPFEIHGVTGVGATREQAFEFHGVGGNPVRGGLHLDFTLEKEGPVTVEAHDIAGRRLLARDLNGLGPGRHRIRLNEELRAGICLVSLRQGTHRRVLRAVVLE